MKLSGSRGNEWNIVTNDMFGLVLGFDELTQKCMMCRFVATIDFMSNSQSHGMLIDILGSSSGCVGDYGCETIVLSLLSDLHP